MTDALSESDLRWRRPVLALRQAMERECAVRALAGGTLPTPENDLCIAEMLQEHLLTPPRGTRRPWVFGRDMVGPEWLWGKGPGRVVNDPDIAGFCLVWTRKAHKAYRRHCLTLSTLAAAILRGEVTDAWYQCPEVIAAVAR